MKEIWKDIPGFEGLYQISNLGRLKKLSTPIHSRSANGNPFIRYSKEKIYLGSLDNHGYYRTTLTKNRTRYERKVHRLVLLTFVGANALDCNHKNYNRSDNRLENLEYCTRAENNYHRDLKEGARDNQCKGSLVHSAKLENKDILKIFKLRKNGLTHKMIGVKLGVSRRAIGNILKRKIWKHVKVPPDLIN